MEFFSSCSWQVAVGRGQLTGGSWQVEGGMWPNCLEAVRKAGIRCPHQLVVGGKFLMEQEEQEQEQDEEYSQHSMY